MSKAFWILNILSVVGYVIYEKRKRDAAPAPVPAPAPPAPAPPAPAPPAPVPPPPAPVPAPPPPAELRAGTIPAGWRRMKNSEVTPEIRSFAVAALRANHAEHGKIVPMPGNPDVQAMIEDHPPSERIPRIHPGSSMLARA